MDGRSLMGLMDGSEPKERSTFSEYHAQGCHTSCFMVRQGQYKYVYIHGYESQLFDLEADPGAGLELIRYRMPEGSQPAELGAPNTVGIRHIAFRVDDLDATARALRTAGVEFLSDIREVPTTQVDFAGDKKRIVYCHDPEGNLLELCAYGRR